LDKQVALYQGVAGSWRIGFFLYLRPICGNIDGEEVQPSCRVSKLGGRLDMLMERKQIKVLGGGGGISLA
jgi:hypothetical protein